MMAKAPSLPVVTFIFSSWSTNSVTLAFGSPRPARIVKPSASRRTSSMLGAIGPKTTVSVGVSATTVGFAATTSVFGVSSAGIATSIGTDSAVSFGFRTAKYVPVPTATTAKTLAPTTGPAFALKKAAILLILGSFGALQQCHKNRVAESRPILIELTYQARYERSKPVGSNFA